MDESIVALFCFRFEEFDRVKRLLLISFLLNWYFPAAPQFVVRNVLTLDLAFMRLC